MDSNEEPPSPTMAASRWIRSFYLLATSIILILTALSLNKSRALTSNEHPDTSILRVIWDVWYRFWESDVDVQSAVVRPINNLVWDKFFFHASESIA